MEGLRGNPRGGYIRRIAAQLVAAAARSPFPDISWNTAMEWATNVAIAGGLKAYIDATEPEVINTGHSGNLPPLPPKFTLPPATEGVDPLPENADQPYHGVSKNLFKMPRGRVGVIGRRFRRPKRKTVSLGARVKLEKGGTGVTTIECSYLGHSTNPVKHTMKMIFLALIDKYMRSCGVHVKYLSQVPENLATPEGLKVQWDYQGVGSTGTGVNSVVVPTSGGFGATATWEDIAVALANSFCNVLQGQKAFNIINIAFMSEDGLIANANVFPYRRYSATDLMITLDCKSILQIQNRTPSSATGLPTTTDEVGANPVRGKSYECVGNVFDFAENLAGGVGAAIGANDEGVLLSSESNVTQDGVPLALAPGLKQYLLKPPRASIFKRCKGSSYQVLRPGEIRKSSMVYKATKSFDQWLQLMHDAIEDRNTVGTNYLDQLRSYTRLPFGKSRLFAFEKYCDAEGTAPVTLGYEHILYMHGFAKTRRASPPLTLTTSKLT